jgi:hypothetical protein
VTHAHREFESNVIDDSDFELHPDVAFDAEAAAGKFSNLENLSFSFFQVSAVDFSPPQKSFSRAI